MGPPLTHAALGPLPRSSLREAKAFTNAFQAAPLISPLPSPLELAEEHMG